jgi:hypothetical protein
MEVKRNGARLSASFRSSRNVARWLKSDRGTYTDNRTSIRRGNASRPDAALLGRISTRLGRRAEVSHCHLDHDADDRN